MSSSPQPLLRLAAHVEQQLPFLLLFALVRWAGATLARPVLRRLLAPLRRRIERLPAKGEELKLPMQTVNVCFAVYFGLVYRELNEGDPVKMWSTPDCRPLEVPRPVGIAAGLGLLYFVMTTRLTVSVLALVVLLCAKDASPFVLHSVLMTMVEWTQESHVLYTLGWVVVGAMAAAHATACGSSSSAALAVAAWAWVPKALTRTAWRALWRWA